MKNRGKEVETPEEKEMYKDENGNEVEVKNIEFIYSVVREQLRVQFDTIDKIDQKANTLMGVNSIVLSIVFTIFGKHRNATVFYWGIAFLFVLLGLLVIEYVVLVWRFDPKPQNFQEQYYGESYNKTINKLTSNIVKSYKESEKIVTWKADLFNWSLMLSAVGIFYIFLSTVIQKSDTLYQDIVNVLTIALMISYLVLSRRRRNQTKLLQMK